MSFFQRFGFASLALILVCSVAAPVSLAQSRTFQYILPANPDSPYLGIQMNDVTSANMSKYGLSSEKGVIVRSVQSGSPAQEAKLQEEDVILEYAGTQVWSTSQFSRLVEETPPGRKVELVVSRGGKRINLTAEIGKREAARRWDSPMDDNDFGQMFRNSPFRAIPAPRNDGSGRPAGKPRLGVTLQPLTEQLGEHFGVPGKQGALISSVQEGSPSAGKLKSGDVVTQVDGTAVRDPEDLIQAVNNKSGGLLTLKVIRDKKAITVEISLPALPAEDGGKGIRL